MISLRYVYWSILYIPIYLLCQHIAIISLIISWLSFFSCLFKLPNHICMQLSFSHQRLIIKWSNGLYYSKSFTTIFTALIEIGAWRDDVGLVYFLNGFWIEKNRFCLIFITTGYISHHFSSWKNHIFQFSKKKFLIKD